MRQIAKIEKDNNRVAVLACGPESLLADVRALCWGMSRRGVHFDYHGETFDF